MNKKMIWVVVGIVALVVIVFLGVYYFINRSASNEAVTDNTSVSTSTADLIHVSIPLPNVLVQSPLVVKGEARGNWYFEASFPVKIFDANGKQLGTVAAQAQGDWMTTDFVPFQATLIFDTPTTETGSVVFMKDNPSGLPQNDASVSIPVYFLATASKL
jgi:uncharacterized protein YneF (UPF0154 family)